MIYYKGEDLDSLIKEGVCIVDFYADWCGPCKMLGSLLEEIGDDVKIIKVNIDEYTDLAEKFKVMSIPHLVYFKNGNEVAYSIGFLDRNLLFKKIEDVKKA